MISFAPRLHPPLLLPLNEGVELRVFFCEISFLPTYDDNNNIVAGCFSCQVNMSSFALYYLFIYYLEHFKIIIRVIINY